VKKLLSGKFLFILAASLIVLIGLVLGAFYLFDDADAKFVKSGYVLNPLSEVSEKYYFDKDTGYHKNLSSMIEFVDTSKKDVSVLADSFLHYDDGALSFLKNGAILDLDSINGADAVRLYNITSASVIEKDGDKYLIKSKNGDITLDNFIGRINDNKYIIVGDLQLQLTGNAGVIEGEYFEIVYIEEGVVNIENKDVKYQVMADGTTIRIGKDLVIDLGDKKIVDNDKDIMSITTITIDGNENVEIIPEVTVEEKPDGEGGTGNGAGGGGNGNGNGDGDGNGENGQGQGGTGEAGKQPVEMDTEVIVTLKEVEINSTMIGVVFDIINARENDSFYLQVVNLNTGRDALGGKTPLVRSEVKNLVDELSPSTKYLFTVSNSRGDKYFQQIFETKSFGIDLEKAYATDNSLSYNVTIEEGTEITKAMLRLYQYNTETKKLDVVKTQITVGEETVLVPCEVDIMTITPDEDGNYNYTFNGLESDTVYTAVLDEFSIVSTNFSDVYNVTLSSMTLKEQPHFSKMQVVENPGAGNFELSLGQVEDPDQAIQKYTYKIYDKKTEEEVLSQVKNNASPLIAEIGEGEGKLSNGVEYYYEIIIEYFDNEKYVEYITKSDFEFMMGDTPYITVVANDEKIGYDKIAGTIYLTDNSCLVSSPKRANCGEKSTATLIISEIDGYGNANQFYRRTFEFDEVEGIVKYDFEVEGLSAGTTYRIDVEAILRNSITNKPAEIKHTTESEETITTKVLSELIVNWDADSELYPSNSEHVVNVGMKFAPGNEEDGDTLSAEETVSSIKKLVLKLYEGSIDNAANARNAIATIPLLDDEHNFKEEFYDNIFNVTSDGTFELTMEDLKALDLDDEDKLSEYYTIIVEAYYDEAGTKSIELTNELFVCEVSKFLLADNLDVPLMDVKPITHQESGKIFSNLTNNTTVVGYFMDIWFDRAGMMADGKGWIPQRVHYYVYTGGGSRRKVNFYILDSETNQLKLVDKVITDLGENNTDNQKIYIDYGTDYNSGDSKMARGNEYYIGYEIEVLMPDENNPGEYVTEMYPQVGPGKFENYQSVKPEKEEPVFTSHVSVSDANSITYNYKIVDPDKALYKAAGSDAYNLYYRLGEVTLDSETGENVVTPVGDAKAMPIEKIDGEVLTFSGNVKLTDLNNGDFYTLYYESAVTKGSGIDKDVKPYDSGMRMFDGYYDAKALDEDGQSLYNFNYRIATNKQSGNKVLIEILADKKMLDRIIAYRLVFTDTKGHKLEKEVYDYQLSSCSSDSDEKRCLSVSYNDLKNAEMKSDKYERNDISVKITALYDNGLTGYDFKVGTDYEYVIFQDNITLTKGKYLAFSNMGQLTEWDPELNVSRGYYTYEKISNYINLEKLKFNNGKVESSVKSKVYFYESGLGYLTRNKYFNLGTEAGYLNPKMISVDEMTAVGENTFWFNSITPKVRVNVNTRLINGAKLSLKLDGADLNDILNEGNSKNPRYYLYIDVWDDESKVGNFDFKVRPTVKKLINVDDVDSALAIDLDGLYDGKKYYFNIYAKMYKDNKVEYTQLYDDIIDKDETKTYNFTSLSTTELFKSLAVSFSSSKQPYGNRVLNTLIDFKDNVYKNVPYNFSLVYIFCDKNNCTIDDQKSSIFRYEYEDVKISNNSSVDITSYNLEYGKNYYMKIYAVANYYSSGNAGEEMRPILLNNEFYQTVPLSALTEPSYMISRDAFLTDDGDYVIDFGITVSDVDRTIVDGKYYVKLIGPDGQVAGKMQLKDENGNLYNIKNDYTKQSFDAGASETFIRIAGLKPDTKYTIVAFADAYVNNYDPEQKDLTDAEKRELRTKEVPQSHTVYSTTDYGVAFGKELIYSATTRSVVIQFHGGSNFQNVTKVRYTVIDSNAPEGALPNATGVYDLLGEHSSKSFTRSTKYDNYRFVIDPTNMLLTLTKPYNVNVAFEVKYNDEVRWITSADNSAFNGQVSPE